jgi:hypothetical protein
MSDAWHTETVDTDAGAYTVELHPDWDCPSHPLDDDDAFVALVEFSGYGGRWDVATDTLARADDAGTVVRALVEKFDHDDAEVGRRYLKWQALTGNPWILAMGGRNASQSEYYRYALLADSRELTDVSKSITAVMDDYQTYASGEVVGYVVKAPNGAVIDSVWGFYSWDDAIVQARDSAQYDATERVEKSNVIGAGFVGIV